MPELTPCEIALMEWKNFARWRNLWSLLLFIFGSAVILFLCCPILLFITQSWLPGAISTLGTIVSSAGVSWVVSRRGEAVKEEQTAYADVQNKCAIPPKAATGTPELMKGKSAESPVLQNMEIDPKVKEEVEAFKKEQGVFGWAAKKS